MDIKYLKPFNQKLIKVLQTAVSNARIFSLSTTELDKMIADLQSQDLSLYEIPLDEHGWKGQADGYHESESEKLQAELEPLPDSSEEYPGQDYFQRHNADIKRAEQDYKAQNPWRTGPGSKS
jgi:hypothetical protein